MIKNAKLQLAQILIVVVSSSACTPTETLIDALSELPGLTIQGQNKHTQIIGSANSPIEIAGECDPRTKNIEAKIADYIPEWNSVTSLTLSGSEINCSNRKFKLTLKSLNDMGAWDTSSAFDLLVLLRGQTPGGPTTVTEVTLKYVPGAGEAKPGFRITSGSGNSSSPSFQVKASLTALQKSEHQSPSFRIKGGATHFSNQ